MGLFNNDKNINLCLENQLQAYGISHYCYFLSPHFTHTAPVILTNYPEEWISSYINASFYQTDPIVLFARQTVMPFSWHDVPELNEQGNNTQNNRFIAHYNIFDGYTFVVHDVNNCLSLLSLCNIDNDSAFHENIKKYQADIQLLLILTHDRMNKSITPFPFSESKESILSSRELEILQWVSLGKTYIESAMILGICERTIKFHMKNIVNKLNVSNARHAIKKAIELNLLT
ncbi:MAG: LuxR family transcriptional regulator [Enterobacteriaceae bacterium]|jgi:LuxR family quorum-sensing system transcriptional regulator ExpR|nr:LuxR family transcriptional regulator [Enterobacteriaceae bacterium]